MMTQEIYNATQDWNEYQRLINTVEVLTQAEYDFCFNWDHIETRNSTSNIGGGRYLNLNVYSEAEHHDRVYRMECGL
jgi:hypothetical protein